MSNEALKQKLDMSFDVRFKVAEYGPELYIAAKSLYDQICNMTTEEFSVGFDKLAREELAKILTNIDGERR